MNEDDLTSQVRGSRLFHPPEVYSSGSKEKARPLFSAKGTDIWAIGCILYILSFGSHPFEADSLKVFKSLLDSREVEYPLMEANNSGDMIIPVIRSCLQKDPKKRLKSSVLIKLYD